MGAVPFLAGLGTGGAILIRPAMVFFLPLAMLWMAARKAYVAAAVLLLVTVLVVAPWTIRNHHVYGRWIAVASAEEVNWLRPI